MYRLKFLTPLLNNSIKVLVDSNACATRSLYAPTTLGIDGFLNARERIKLQITNIEGFKSKMVEFVKDETSKNLIFTEDLKNMVHLCENQDDVKLLRTMVEKFNTQSREVRFGNFVFGPPIMRVFHNMKDPDTALSMFKDEKLSGFFDQLISYQILLDLLYETGRFQEVLDTYKIITDRQIQGGRYPKHVLVLTFAACYKLNTPESFEFAKKLWTEINEVGHFPMRRATTYMAGLALKQGQPQIALEVVSIVKQQNYLTIRSIKALAYASLKRYDDVIPILRSVLEIDNPMANKQTFPIDLIDQLKKNFEGCSNKDLQADFTKVVGFLEKHGHVSKDTLESILCSEIVQTMQTPGTGRDDPRFQNRGDNRGDYRGDFRNQRRNERGGYQRREFDYPSERTRRPGLHELN